MTFEQYVIPLFGVTAVFLAQRHDPRLRRWAPVFGLASQPFWFWAAYSRGMWGMVIMTVLYTFVWAHGLYTFWWRRDESRRST